MFNILGQTVPNQTQQQNILNQQYGHAGLAQSNMGMMQAYQQTIPYMQAYQQTIPYMHNGQEWYMPKKHLFCPDY